MNAARNASTTPTSSSGAPWRRAVELAIPLVAIVVTVVAPLLVWSRLPDPMASHWSWSGVPDQALPRLAELVLISLVTVAIGLGPLLAARTPMPRVHARALVATATGGGVLFAALRVLTVQANLDVTRWQDADPLTVGAGLGVLVAGVVAGAVGAWLAGDRPDLAVVTTSPSDVEVAPGEAVVWSGGASGRTAVALPCGLLVASAIGAWLVPGEARVAVLVVLPVLAVAATLLGQARVTVGPRGLTVALGWFGWPRLRVPLDHVRDVAVEDVQPANYGGWGLRQVPGTTAVVIRRGPGLRVTRTNGRTFVVTVDDAATAAGVLLAHQRAAGRP